MESLKELIDQRNKLVFDARKILDTAESEKRELSAEDRQQYERIDADIEKIQDKIGQKQSNEKIIKRRGDYDRMLSEDLPRQVTPSATKESTTAPRFNFGRAGEVSLADVSNADPRLAERLTHLASEDYRARFQSYVRGDGRAEKLGLITGNDPQGGYLAPVSFTTMFIKFLDDMTAIRQLATVLPPTTAKSVGALSYDTDYADSDWTAEVPASDISEDDAARFGKREMTPHLLTKAIKTSRKMLRSSMMPLESFLAQRLAYRFAITENKAYLSGSGAQRPLGAFVASADGITTARDTTCASATVFTADELIDVQHSVKDVYRQNGTWVASRTFRKMVRKLKDSQGQYLLVTNNASSIDTLLERPLVVDENAPGTFTTGLYTAVFGDWKNYWIQDALDFEVQRLDEVGALKNQVIWIARKETDGMPVLAEAFGRLKMG